MSDEQTIYISPDDDLTTVRGRLEQIPARKITLVIPNQTQLRSHVAWKLLYARTRELNKEVLIVSSDPQVRSVAHAVKFRVAHSLESTSNPGRSKSGSRSGPGRSNAGTGRSRPTVPPKTSTRATTAKEPIIERAEPRPSRPLGSPIAGQMSTWSEPDERQQSHFNASRSEQADVIRPPLFNLPERPQRNEPREERGSRFNQSYDFHIENPSSIHPLYVDQVEEPDLLIEDYEQAQDIRQAASGSLPAIKKQLDSEPGNTSPGDSNAPISHVPADLSHHSNSQIYGEDDPFIYMQDDSQPPSQAEQKGEATIEDEEISQAYPSLQKSAIADLPTGVIENKIEYRGDDDEDDIIPPISPKPITQSRPRPEQRPVIRQEPEPIPLPMPRAQSKPLPPTSRPLTGRTTGKIPDKATTQKPITAPATRGGSRVPPSVASRPASQPVQQRGGSTRPKSATGLQPLRPPITNRRPASRRLYFILAPIAAILIILFLVFYLNIASTVSLMITTQSYTHAVTLTLSNKNLPNTVAASPITRTFTKTASEPATGSKMQATNYATGIVNFTNTGTKAVEIPSQTVIATTDNINFVTTENVLVLPQSTNTFSLPVAIQASNSGVAGNVSAGSITVIPQSSLATIAQAQTTPVTTTSLQTILTVTNPDATTGGEAKPIAAITQQDLDNATKDLHQQVLPDINTWMQQNAKNGLVGQAVTTDTLLNPPPVNEAEPNKTFSANIKVIATILVVRLDVAQRAAVDLLNSAVHADKQFGPAFAIIGDAQTIKIDQAQPGSTNGNAVTVNATGQVGPNLDIKALQNSISGKSFSQAQAIVRQQSQHIQTVNIQTQLGIFNSVSPWADHITIIIQPSSTPKKS
jgi:Baseplate J-like protein